MVKRLILLLLLLTVKHAGADEDVIAVTERSTVSIKCPIKCLVNNKSVVWDKKPYGLAAPRHVYNGMMFLNGFVSSRFSLDSNSQPGRCNLLINNVETTDAGRYICRDTSNSPKEWSSNLVVTDPLECHVKSHTDTYIGENEFGLTQTAITFRCTLLYRGNMHLALKMTLHGKEYEWFTHNYEYAQEFQHMVYGELSLVSTTKNMNNGKFLCEAIMLNSSSGHYHNTSNVRWQSDLLDIKFAKLENPPVDECPRVASSLNCNPPCTYEQKQHSNGTYYCQTYYTLNGQTYIKQVVSYYSGYDSKSEAKNYKIIAVTATATIIVILVVLVIYVLSICRKRVCQRSSNDNTQQPGNDELTDSKAEITGSPN